MPDRPRDPTTEALKILYRLVRLCELVLGTLLCENRQRAVLVKVDGDHLG